jgi:adenine-specific DNA-methyltransferase
VQPRSARKVQAYCVGSEVDQSRSQIIEGENLQAMVTLYRERGRVDLILADPPYNTGKDFRYNDRWEEDPNDSGLGDFVGEDEEGRHTKWMRFMLPRLRMMKSMLKPGGVLAVCIDHRELFRLGQMLDELFKEENRVAIINWQKSYAPRSDNKHVSTATEYVLVYTKNIEQAKTSLLDRSQSANSRYKNVDNDPEGDWREHDLSARTPSAKDQYGVQSPFTGTVYYPGGTQSWRHPKANIRKWIEEWGVKCEYRNLDDGRAPAIMVRGGKVSEPLKETRGIRQRAGAVPKAAAEAARARLEKGSWPFIWFGLDGAGGPRVKRYLHKVRKGMVPMTYWADEDYDEPLDIGTTSWDHEESGRSQTGVKELNAIVGKGHGFETVKPLKLFSKIIQLWCPPTGLVLDPFAGSGTTGHAVLQLNADVGTERRFILIEQGRPERGDPYARSLMADRLKRVVTGKWATGAVEGSGGGFRFCALQSKVDAKALLGMERDEMTDAVIASHFDSARSGSPNLVTMTHDGYQYLVARNADNEGFYLVWQGAKEQPIFTEDVYEHVVAEAKKAGLKARYHVYARFNLFQSDDTVFYQIPNRILLDFGLSQASDAFNNEPSDALTNTPPA